MNKTFVLFISIHCFFVKGIRAEPVEMVNTPLVFMLLCLTSHSYGTKLPLGNRNASIVEEDSSQNTTQNPCSDSDSLPSDIEQKLQEDLENFEEESNCQDCTERKANLTGEELRLLRIEVVKQQILSKLKMPKPPCSNQPKPSVKALRQAAQIMGIGNDNVVTDINNDNRNDIDGKTKSILIYPTRENLSCLNMQNNSCSRLRFELAADLELSAPSSAAIWLYKKDASSILKLTELVFHEYDGHLLHQRLLAIESGDPHSKQVKFQLPLSTTWLQPEVNRATLDVQLSCYSGCTSDASTNMVIEDNAEEMPFLVVNFQIDSSTTRSRRSVDCIEDSVFCCRESLYISFQEIGYGDWIFEPDGYHANFCKGKCIHDISNAKFHHSTILHRYIINYAETAEEIGLKMCCTPSRLSSIPILYTKNQTIIKTTLLNMKVEACDCA